MWDVQESSVRGVILGGNYFRCNCLRAIFLGVNCPGGNCLGVNYPRWELSGRQLSRGEFSCSHFSDDLKIADIPLIYKKNNRNDQANYRLASILLVIFEKCCYDQLFKNVNSILSTYETGYRKSCSSQHCNVWKIEGNLQIFHYLQTYPIRGVWLIITRFIICQTKSL